MFRKILFSSCLILINFQSAKSVTARCLCEKQKLLAIRNANSVASQGDNKPGDGKIESTAPELTDHERRLFFGPTGYRPLTEEKRPSSPKPVTPRPTKKPPPPTTTRKPRPPPKKKPPKPKKPKLFEDLYSDDEPVRRPRRRNTKFINDKAGVNVDSQETLEDLEEIVKNNDEFSKKRQNIQLNKSRQANINENVNQVEERQKLNGGSVGARPIVAGTGISLGEDVGLGGLLDSSGVGLGARLAGSSQGQSSGSVGLGVGLSGSSQHQSNGNNVGLGAGLANSPQRESIGGFGQGVRLGLGLSGHKEKLILR